MPESLPEPAAEILVSLGNYAFPCLPLEEGHALVLFSEDALNLEEVGIHVGDVIEIGPEKEAVRTVARKHVYQSRFLLAWDGDVSPVGRVVDVISHYGGRCIGYLPERRVLVVLHDKPLTFPSPPDILIVASRPQNQRLV